MLHPGRDGSASLVREGSLSALKSGKFQADSI